MKTILLGLFALPILASANVGFETGNNFVSTYVEGEVSVTCRSGFDQSYAAYRCSSDLLDPAEFVKIRGPKGLDAEKLYVRATREDGSQQEKSEKYDSETGLTKGRFNLWIHTVFQRPLLKSGVNTIEYRYTKGSNTVLKGRFQALVTHAPDRVCRYRRHYYSNNLDDCRNGNFICDRYFRDENYCQE